MASNRSLFNFDMNGMPLRRALRMYIKKQMQYNNSFEQGTNVFRCKMPILVIKIPGSQPSIPQLVTMEKIEK
jgi:hypothetical protein